MTVPPTSAETATPAKSGVTGPLLRSAEALGRMLAPLVPRGRPNFIHPLEVAAILTELKLDVPTIVTALLHDTVEDTYVTIEDVTENFGEEIANLVDGVTKLSQLELFSERTTQAE